MANCKYIIGGKTFNSEIELDDYLSEIKDLHKKYGDEVFSKKWTTTQQKYREKIFSQKEQLERAIKSGYIKLEISDMDDMDLDGIVGSLNSVGVTELIKNLKNLDDKNVFPIFDRKNYWDHVKNELFSGKIDKLKDYIPYIYEKDSNGEYIIEPIQTDDQFEKIKNRIEKMWRQQGLIGTVVHDIFDIMYDKNKRKTENGGDLTTMPINQAVKELKKILSKKDYSLAYQKLLQEFGTDINNNEEFLESVITNALQFNEELKKQFDPHNEGLMILPEITIQGAAILNNKNYKVIGRLDMLIIKPDGEIHIVDYKCSPKEYDKYNDAKKLTFEYQLAVYRRILQQLGLNSTQGIHLWVVPVQFTNFDINKDNNKVSLNGIKLREGAVFEELKSSSPVIDAKRYETIENNLNNSFQSTYVEDIAESEILTKTSNWIKKVFPEYASIRDNADENIQKYCKGRVIQDPKTGKWGFRKTKNSELKYVQDTEQGVINAIKQDWTNSRKENLERCKSIKTQLKKAQKENLGKQAEFNITRDSANWKTKSTKVPNWAQIVLQKYANNKWMVVDNSPEVFDSLGIILVRNLLTGKIDVIKLSYTYDLDAKIEFGNNRNTLFGNYVSDHVAKTSPNSLVMSNTRGNMELMETMYALNCIPSLFNNDNAFIGEIQLLNPYNEGGGANNKALMYNFWKLIQYSNKSDSPETNYFDGKIIKMASFVQLASDTLHQIINGHPEPKWQKMTEVQNRLFSALGNKEKTMAELFEIKKQLEENYKELGQDGITTVVYDDYVSPEKRLYAEVMLAIGELNGLTYQQQTDDHANFFEGKSVFKALVWDGFNGNLTDNPGTLRSETLNQASHLVDVAYQNIRDQLFKYKNSLEEVLDAYKKYKGVTLSQDELYKNFYNDNIKDDLVFKNPFDSNTDLDDIERDVLKRILFDITKRREPNITNMAELEELIASDDDYLLVPLMGKSGKPVVKTVLSFLGKVRQFLIGFNPKNIVNTLKSKAVDYVNSDEKNQDKVDDLWSMSNEMDASKDRNIRKNMITNRGGIQEFENNLEMLALKHEYSYIQKEEVNKILPFMKALSIHLANQGIILNDNFENDLAYIKNFIKSKIKNKSLQNIEALDNSLVKETMKATSVMALAFNPKQLYQCIDGLWKDCRIVFQNAHSEGDKNLTQKNFKDSFFWIIKDIADFNGEMSLGEALNQQYGINDMDINSLPSRYAKDTYGTDRLQKAMFRFASRPDYYNRMTIFGAQMRGDGCFEAHSIKDGKLIYDWTKDKRFDVFAKYKGQDSKVPENELAKYREQKALYYTMASEMVKDGTLNPDGSIFVLDMKNPRPLPKAYTVRQSESMKALGDKTYGYYASEKKSLIQSFTLGALLFQMNTFWSSKKNQYFSGRGYTQEGEFVDYVEENPEDPEHPIEYCQKYNEETGEMDIIRKDVEDTGVPFKVWKGRPQEGIVITTTHMLYDLLTGRRDEEGQKLWDLYWNNDDPYLRKMYRANLRQLLADLLGMIIIGGLIAPSLVNAAQDYSKFVGTDSLGGASVGYMAILGASMFDTSTDDFNFTKSVFGRGIQWTPFSLQSATRSFENWGKFALGDRDFYDSLVNTMSFTRNAKPVFDYIKLETTGRKIGQKPE